MQVEDLLTGGDAGVPEGVGSTGAIVPCRYPAGTGTVTVSATLYHMWPDGLIERTIHPCSYTACYLPYRYHSSTGLVAGAYNINVTSEESTPGCIYCPMPSGGAHRTYTITG